MFNTVILFLYRYKRAKSPRPVNYYIDWKANSISAVLWFGWSQKFWLLWTSDSFKNYGWPNRNFSIVLELSCLPVGDWKDRMLCVGWAIVSRVSSDKCSVKNKISVEQNENMTRNSNRKSRFLLFSVTVLNFLNTFMAIFIEINIKSWFQVIFLFVLLLNLTFYNSKNNSVTSATITVHAKCISLCFFAINT